MLFKSKFFNELTTKELYEILKARCAVFLLEQNIICQDLDDIDYNSLHCFFEQDNKVIAYLRAFKADDDTVKIGRVLTLNHGQGLGRKIMELSINAINKKFCYKRLSLNAQKYASGFYEKLGFTVVSDDFLEEGIVHVTMDFIK